MNQPFLAHERQLYVQMLKKRQLWDPDNPPTFTNEEYTEYLNWRLEEVSSSKKEKTVQETSVSDDPIERMLINYNKPDNIPIRGNKKRAKRILAMPKRKISFRHRMIALVSSFFFASTVVILMLVLFILFFDPPQFSKGQHKPLTMRFIKILSEDPKDEPKEEESKPEPKSIPDEKPKPKPEPLPEPEPKKEPLPEPEPKPIPDEKPEPEPLPEPKPKKEPLPVIKTKPTPLEGKKAKVVESSSTPEEKRASKLKTYLSQISSSKKLQHRLSGQNRDMLREIAGGSDEVPKAVNRALKWLHDHQHEDGSWKAAFTHKRCLKLGHSFCGGDARADYPVRFNTAVTSLTLMCFLGAGHTHIHGDYRETIKKAANWLVDAQNSKGHFGPLESAPIYCTSISCLALLELSELTDDALALRCKEAAFKGLSFLVNCQNKCGGWDYSSTPEFNVSSNPPYIKRKNRGDTPITSWCMMSLTSGIHQGYSYGEGPRALATLFLRGQCLKNGMVYYDTSKQIAHHLGTIAAALLNEQYSFLHSRKNYRDAQSRFLLKHPPKWDDNLSISNSPYYWYLATAAFYHRGGPDWVQWYSQMEPFLLSRQETREGRKGSWPTLMTGHGKKIAETGGRVLTTAMCTLTLESTWRFLPMYAYNPKTKNMSLSNMAPKDVLFLKEATPKQIAYAINKLLKEKELSPEIITQIESFMSHEDKLLRIQAARLLIRRQNEKAIPVMCQYIKNYPKDGWSSYSVSQLIKYFPKHESIPDALWALVEGSELPRESMVYLRKLRNYSNKKIANLIRNWIKTQTQNELIKEALITAKQLDY